MFNERTVNLFRCQRDLTAAAVLLTQFHHKALVLPNVVFFKKKIPADDELFAHISEQT